MSTRGVLIVDDEATQRELVAGYLRQLELQVSEAEDGVCALERVRTGGVDLVLLDQRMPRLDGIDTLRELRRLDPSVDVIVVTAYGSVKQAVEAVKLGATDYLTKPIDLDRLELVVRNCLERRLLRHENQQLREKLAGGPRFSGIISGSGVMEELLNAVARAAPTEATVLVTGESGTGKELVARALHAASRRAAGPFVAVHCAALAESVLESELFGHEKGAFTGASCERMGRFESASGGTLFLDEIAEIPASVQVKLLRVLQERQVERVGSNRPRSFDVRLVAATSRDVSSLVADGCFREDLYYRLAVVKLFIPPLRHRREDIRRLVEHFLDKHRDLGTQPVGGISQEALWALLRYRFPGNVRELENLIQSAIVMTRHQVITCDDLPPVVRGCHPEEGLTWESFEGSLREQVENLERGLIADALDAEQGVQTRAAERLGISERTLRYKLEKYALKPAARSTPN